ncbi:MAG TPA: bifunctional hydroxymethylpyrimidine kinase/phosphomethylpyrimidine kinase [Candidatus Angelobacter sp.]|nr:bifunctional hydroxymethylpyrimidine kinase/phosphomethylpyrimidine kinase [Candidatus Angelobacter sp.]
MAHRKKNRPPVVLSIAGYDPSSGAGITADIKTIAAHGCYGVTCITALTVQSTRGVMRVEPVQGKTITETLENLADDLAIAAVKIGMIGSAETAQAVTTFLEHHSIPTVVLDPIIKSSSCADLISQEGLQIMKTRLLSQAHVITPNIDEATALTGMAITNPDEMEAAALRLQKLGAQSVIITGGHLNPPHDLVCRARKKPTFLKGKKIQSRSTHGTGCAFSTALACELALGRDLLQAAKAAKRFVEAALRRAPAIGKGIGPVL